MIDTEEMRRLTQAATPGPWINYGRQPNAPGAPHSAVAAKTLLARVYSEAYGDVAQETANADLIAAANPAALSELLDRLEAAEKERDALRAKIEAMEKQEPAGTLHDDGYFVWRKGCPYESNYAGWKLALYALPGAKRKKYVSNIHTTAELLAEIRALRTSLLDANDLCRSAFQVANRVATELGTHVLQSNFGALADRLHESLQRQHEVLMTTGGYVPVQAQPAPSVCTWVEDEGVWHSDCGGAVWQFTDEGPAENGMKFCLACGRPLEVLAPEAKP